MTPSPLSKNSGSVASWTASHQHGFFFTLVQRFDPHHPQGFRVQFWGGGRLERWGAITAGHCLSTWGRPWDAQAPFCSTAVDPRFTSSWLQPSHPGWTAGLVGGGAPLGAGKVDEVGQVTRAEAKAGQGPQPQPPPGTGPGWQDMRCRHRRVRRTHSWGGARAGGPGAGAGRPRGGPRGAPAGTRRGGGPPHGPPAARRGGRCAAAAAPPPPPPRAGPPCGVHGAWSVGQPMKSWRGRRRGGGDKWRTLEKAGWGGVGPTRQGSFTPPSNQPPCSCWGCWSARHLQMRMPEERPQTKHIPGHSDNSLPLNLTLRSVSNGPDCRLWWQTRPLLKMQFDFAQLRTSLIYFDLNVQKITRLSVNNGA